MPPHNGARAITIDYPDGTKLLWTREIPSNTWRCRVLSFEGEAQDDDMPVITGYDRIEMERIIDTALQDTASQ